MSELTEQLGKFVAPEPLLDDGGMNAKVLDSARVPVQPAFVAAGTETVAPGRPAMLPAGIIYQADWKKIDDGMARHARQQAKALSVGGVPTSLRSITDEQMYLDDEAAEQVWAEVGYLARTSLKSAPAAIRHCVLHGTDFLRAVIAPAGARLAGFEAEKRVWSSTIIYTSWERSTIAPSLVELLNRCGQVWLPCERSVEVFRAAGVTSALLRRVPYPYDPDSAVCRIAQPRGSGLVPRGKRFYNIGKWEPRKNHNALVGAFLRAFTPADHASLYIKTHGWGDWEGYPTPDESVAAWLKDERVANNGWTKETLKKRLWIADRRLTEEAIGRLHARNNIYVSAAHGEGWDLPAFDARCAGNRLVHVGYGGTEDFADPKHDIAVPYRMGPVHPGYGWEASAEWAHYEVEDLAAAMSLVEPPEERLHPSDFAGRFGRHAVGELMRRCVYDLLGALSPTLCADFERLPTGFG